MRQYVTYKLSRYDRMHGTLTIKVLTKKKLYIVTIEITLHNQLDEEIFDKYVSFQPMNNVNWAKLCFTEINKACNFEGRLRALIWHIVFQVLFMQAETKDKRNYGWSKERMGTLLWDLTQA